MRMAKTDQAAWMCSSCCRNTSAQPYRGTHIYACINEYHWTMGSLNVAYIDRLLDNHVVISDVYARDRLIMGYGKKSPHSQVSYKIGLLCSANVTLVCVLRTACTCIVQKRVRMKTCLLSLVRTILLEFVSAAVFRRHCILRKDTVCHVQQIPKSDYTAN